MAEGHSSCACQTAERQCHPMQFSGIVLLAALFIGERRQRVDDQLLRFICRDLEGTGNNGSQVNRADTGCCVKNENCFFD